MMHPARRIVAAVILTALPLCARAASTTVTLQQVAKAAMNAVPQSSIGAESGVAGLDSGGHVTAPILGDVTDAPYTPSGGTSTTLQAYLGTLGPAPDLSPYLKKSDADTSFCALSGCDMAGSVSAPGANFTGYGIAIGNSSGQANAPLIGFKTLGDATNTVSLQGNGGSSGADGSGTLVVRAASVSASGSLQTGGSITASGGFNGDASSVTVTFAD